MPTSSLQKWKICLKPHLWKRNTELRFCSAPGDTGHLRLPGQAEWLWSSIHFRKQGRSLPGRGSSAYKDPTVWPWASGYLSVPQFPHAPQQASPLCCYLEGTKKGLRHLFLSILPVLVLSGWAPRGGQ